MRLKAYKSHTTRRKTDPEGWEKTIDSLAISLCPTEEWQAYEKQLQAVAWKANRQKNSARVSVFPVWRKYRQKASRVASLYRRAPILRHLPLNVVSFIGDVLFR